MPTKRSAHKTSAELSKQLAQRSKEDLIILIQQMLQRQPELQILLEMPLPGTQDSHIPLDRQGIRRQVEQAFARSDGGWGWNDPHKIYKQLKGLFQLARGFLGEKNVHNAAIIYQEMMDVCLNYGDALRQDDEGHLRRAVDESVEGLGKCLPDIEAQPERQALLRTLFDGFAFNVRQGGIEVAGNAPAVLVTAATPLEQQEIAAWATALLPKLSGWGQATMGGLILDLQEDLLDDEGFLHICRQSGRLDDLVERLLKLGRVDEAVAEARQASDYGLLSLADEFVRQQHPELSRRLVQERIEDSKDTRLVEWLIQDARQQGDLAAALTYAHQRFWMDPGLEEYITLRDLAGPSSQWPELRSLLLEKLGTQEKHRFLLVEIYLEDAQIDAALQALEKVRQASTYAYVPDYLQVHVAEAAEETRPQEALRLYMELALDLIQQQGRANYVKAMEYLHRVRSLYQRYDALERWETFITQLRQDHYRAPALLEELNRANL